MRETVSVVAPREGAAGIVEVTEDETHRLPASMPSVLDARLRWKCELNGLHAWVATRSFDMECRA